MNKVVLRFILLISFIPLLCVSCIKEGGEKWEDVINHVKVGDKIPAFTITEEDGSSISSDDFTGKRSVIVLFTVTCSDCQRELPILNQAYGQMKNNAEFADLLFVGFARADKPEATERYWTEKNFDIPVYHDLDRSVFELFANSTVPRVYVVDKQGKVTWMGIETLNITAAQLIQKIREIE